MATSLKRALSRFVRVPRFQPKPYPSSLERQKQCSLIQLPDEILAFIVSLLSDLSKATLIRTCRYFKVFLEPILYRHLDLRRAYKHDLLLRTLTGRPDLTPLIQTYAGYLHTLTVNASTQSTRRFYFTRRSNSTNSADRENYRNTAAVLTQANNIRDLYLGTSIDWESDPDLKPVLKAVCQMELVKFTYCASPSDNNQLCRILAAQPTLEELVIYGNVLDLGQLDAAALPRLNRLTSGLEDAVALVPGRGIEELSLCCYPNTNSDRISAMFPRLSLGARAVRQFSMTFLCGGGEGHFGLTLGLVGPVFPKVETLSFSWGGFVRANVILDGFPSLPYLLRLDIKYVGLIPELTDDDHEGPLQHQSEASEWTEIQSTIKQRCPSLVHFSYPAEDF